MFLELFGWFYYYESVLALLAGFSVFSLSSLSRFLLVASTFLVLRSSWQLLMVSSNRDLAVVGSKLLSLA